MFLADGLMVECYGSKTSATLSDRDDRELCSSPEYFGTLMAGIVQAMNCHSPAIERHAPSLTRRSTTSNGIVFSFLSISPILNYFQGHCDIINKEITIIII